MISRRDTVRFIAALAAIPATPNTAFAGRQQRESMDDRIERVMVGWDRIDEHRTGSPGDAQTARWLSSEIESLGADPEIEEFAFNRLIPVDPCLEFGTQRIAGLPCFDAPGTPPEGIEGRLVPLGGNGEIGLLRFEPIGPTAGRLLDARRTTSHQALIAVCEGNSVAPGLAVINADAYGTPYGPPVLQVATAHLELLTEAAGSAEQVRLTTVLQQEQTSASNVGTTILGREPGLAPVVIMTPRSGWWRCTSERGGGLATWLECLHRITRQRPLRTVRFTANTGHELGHVGLDYHLERNQGLVGDAHCWMHLGANFAARDGFVLYQASDEELMTQGRRFLGEAGQPPDRTTPVGTRPLGEARNIFDGGGRYVSLLGSNPLFHHPDDRWPDAIDVDKARRTAEAMVRLAVDLANQT